MVWRGVKEVENEDETEPWNEASVRAEDMVVSEWRDIVGIPYPGYADTDGLKVIEWGGMEIMM